MELRGENLCGIKLRTLCLVIGCMHLVSSVLDICWHVLTVGIVTNGYQCDVDANSLKKVSDIQFLEPLLLVTNLGTHGFYPFPHIIRSQYSTYIEYMAVTTTGPRCYPGVLHVYVVDVLNFLINIIWLKFVISYMKALCKRDHESMRMFVSMSIVKLVMQIMYLGYYPPTFDGVPDFQTFWLLKIMDIVIAFYLLMVIKRYANYLKAEDAASRMPEPVIEKPPSYFECLIATSQPIGTEGTRGDKKDAVIEVGETKKAESPKEI